MSAEYSVDAAFDAWVATLPAKHWAKYDISACRLGWEAQKAERIKADEGAVPTSSDHLSAVLNNVLDGAVIDGTLTLKTAREIDAAWRGRTRPPAQAAQMVYVCSNQACRAAYKADPMGHCPTCVQPNGSGWSTLPREVL